MIDNEDEVAKREVSSGEYKQKSGAHTKGVATQAIVLVATLSSTNFRLILWHPHQVHHCQGIKMLKHLWQSMNLY